MAAIETLFLIRAALEERVSLYFDELTSLVCGVYKVKRPTEQFVAFLRSCVASAPKNGGNIRFPAPKNMENRVKPTRSRPFPRSLFDMAILSCGSETGDAAGKMFIQYTRCGRKSKGKTQKCIKLHPVQRKCRTGCGVQPGQAARRSACVGMTAPLC